VGVAFVDANIRGCSLCLTMFAYQGILGIGYNATPAMRISVEGRYYGTTNPRAYFNNNIMALLSLSSNSASRKWRRRHRLPGSRAAVVHGVLRLRPLEPEPAGLEHDQAGGRRLQAAGQCADHGDRPHRHFRT
jgi:hypothetical protein